MINHNGHACIADFGLLTIVSDQETFLLVTCTEGGTIPWMSPELLDPERFGFEEFRLTKESDCYALGMVIYEVLSGRTPFNWSLALAGKITNGERPTRPQGVQGEWFGDSLWEMLEGCWKAQPKDRPSVKTVLEGLQDVTPPSRP